MTLAWLPAEADHPRLDYAPNRVALAFVGALQQVTRSALIAQTYLPLHHCTRVSEEQPLVFLQLAPAMLRILTPVRATDAGAQRPQYSHAPSSR